MKNHILFLKSRFLPVLVIGLTALVATAWSLTVQPEPSAQLKQGGDFERVRPLLEQYCYRCHGETRQSGDFRLDKLDPDMVGGADADRWHEVLNRISVGDMPPEKAAQPKAKEIEVITFWLRAELLRAAKKGGGGPILRRMTREEYNYTLQDLLGLPIDFANELPTDGMTAEGFVNNGEVLGISPLHLEYYVKIADRALTMAIVTGGPPPVYHYRFRFGTDKRGFKLLPENLSPTFKAAPDALKSESAEGTRLAFGGIRRDEIGHGEGWIDLYPSQRPPVNKGVRSQRGPQPMFQFWLRHYPQQGEIRIRVTAASMAPKGGPRPHLAVCVARKAGNGIEFAEVGPVVIVDAPADRPKVYGFRGRLENMPVAPDDSAVTAEGRGNETIVGVWNAYDRDVNDKEEKPQPHLRVFSVEVEAPYLEQWPPAHHVKLLGKPPADDSAKGEEKRARTVITNFLRRAWHRPPTTAEVDRLLARWRELRLQCGSFAESMRMVLVIPLVSPHFLMLTHQAEGKEQGTPLGDYELAARLSYFLWSSLPDDRLLELAAAGELHRPKVLREEVHRMLRDEKAWRMVRAFTHQWLDLGRLDDVRVQPTRTFTVGMKEAMRCETEQFVGEVLFRNLSTLNFIDSEFAMLNHYLAQHYGIAGVEHPDFRPVPVRPEDHRGGLLTQGSILTAGSDGHQSHPVKRGVWLLKQLLDDPPPPPPPNVPDLEVNDSRDFRRLPFKEKLKIHRTKAACHSCHCKIDPWGVAMETYDATGLYRDDKVRDRERIDHTALMADGTEVAGVAGLKEYLLKHRREQFARALVKKSATYALGRSLTYSDDNWLTELTERFERQGYRLQPLIEDIVLSDAFTRR